MPKIDLDLIEPKRGSDYPHPFELPLAGREARSVARAGGLIDFNANHVTVPPGCWSSQRHWHEGEDELVVILSGDAVLVDDVGRHPMTAGDVAVFPKGDGNGHKLINESDAPLVLVAVSKPETSKVVYSDIDLVWTPEGGELHRDGRPYRGGA
ncbi:putative cupin superfamily protein [Sphingomonas sp. UYAg733]